LAIKGSEFETKYHGYATYNYFSFYDLLTLISMISTIALSIADPVTDIIAIVTFYNNGQDTFGLLLVIITLVTLFARYISFI